MSRSAAPSPRGWGANGPRELGQDRGVREGDSSGPRGGRTPGGLGAFRERQRQPPAPSPSLLIPLWRAYNKAAFQLRLQ